jgi:hypothetical protein
MASNPADSFDDRTRREDGDQEGVRIDDSFFNGGASDGERTRGQGAPPSASTVLMNIAEELYEFGISDAGETYGVPRTGPKVVLLLRGGRTSLRAQLARQYRHRVKKVAPQQALADALLTLDGFAQDEEPQRLWQRVAQHDGALWLDLGDQSGRAVKITAAGWSVEDAAPVLFRRTVLTGALPEPVRGGKLDELWSWLNVAENDRPLLAGYLVAALRPDIPHPVLGLNGEQGTAKTTVTKVIVSTLDPSPVPSRKAPKDEERWVTAAAGSWVVGLDNLGYLPDWLSDSICRAVTGEGDVRRKLYSDGDLTVFAFRRCIIANGIDFGTLRGDFADRFLPMELELIDDADRMEENELWPRWERAHPRILGAVLDLAAAGLAALHSVELDKKPRMADFARTLAATDRVLGTKGLARYLDKQATLAASSLTGDPFITAIKDWLRVGRYEGTAAELLEKVTPNLGVLPKGWPGHPRAVTTRLRRQAPVMRKAGWTVTDDGGKNKAGVARWTIIPPGGGHPREAWNSSPPNPPNPPFAGQEPFSGGTGFPADDPPGGATNPPNPPSPATDPPVTRQETAGHGTFGGSAGKAGQESGPLYNGGAAAGDQGEAGAREGGRTFPPKAHAGNSPPGRTAGTPSADYCRACGMASHPSGAPRHTSSCKAGRPAGGGGGSAEPGEGGVGAADGAFGTGCAAPGCGNQRRRGYVTCADHTAVPGY